MAPDPETRTVETPTHRRYLVRVPDAPEPWPTIFGFHGYGENAERHLRALQRIPGHARWLLVSVQALHLFYHKEDLVVASWMTKVHRELAIADNIRYVGSVVEAVRREYATRVPLVFAGFSQGVAMAYRAAAHYQADALIALAGDVPPDVAAATPRPLTPRLPPVLIGRGTRDGWYTPEKHDQDLATLRGLGVDVESCVFDGAHEWTADFYAAAGNVLARLYSLYG
jgi:predicted esterase